MKKRMFVGLLILLLLSCDLVSQTSSDQPTTDIPQVSATQTPEPQKILPTSSLPSSPQPEVVFTPTARSISEAPLSQHGPWWVFFSGEGVWADGIWAVNPDGSGLTMLTNQHIIKPRDLRTAVSPTSGTVAFISATDPQMLRGLTLNLLKLPEGEIKTVTPLSSADTESEVGADPSLRPPESLLAITQETSLAWSPDGRYLAFMGAHEGPSSDLYIYKLEDESITRLTDGPSEGIRPNWSPDGRYILHLGVYTLGTGASFSMAGVWAARADNSGVKTLYDPSASDDEIVVGWIDDDTFAIYTLSVSLGGAMNLRTINIETGAVNILWEGFFKDVAFDPSSGNMLLLVDEYAASNNPDGETGLYLIGPERFAWKVLDEKPYQTSWSPEIGLFFAYTEFGVVVITPEGDWNQLHDFTGQIPVASPIAKELAWYGNAGLWIGNLVSSVDQPQPLQVFTDPVVHASWGPQGQNLLFFSEDGLYVVQKPDLISVQVAELTSKDAGWVLQSSDDGPSVPPPTPTPVQDSEPTLTTEPTTVPPLAPGDSVTVTTIQMIDASNGWAIGGVGDASDLVLKTSDGGNSWTIVKFLLPVPEGEEETEEIGFVGDFLDTQIAWITIDSPKTVPGLIWVWRTIDGGQTWKLGELMEIGGLGMYYSPLLRFVDAEHGWFLGEITSLGAGTYIDLKLFRTTDGGDLWTDIRFDRYHITGMSFADAQTGWITEERTGPWADPVRPVVWMTDDGGLNWQSKDLPEPADNPGLFTRYRFCATYWPTMFSPQSGAFIVRCFDSAYSSWEAYIYWTSDDAQTWQANSYPGGELQFSSDTVGWALGGDIYQTLDVGKTWAKIKRVNWDGQFSFIDDQTAWAVARSGEKIALVKTTNGGRTWEQLDPQIARP